MKARVAVLGLLFLAACAGPRPRIPAEAGFVPPTAWRGAADPSAAPIADWWKTFGNPALAQVVQDALANNVDLAVAAERVQEARAQYKLAQAQRLPDLGGGLRGGRTREVNPGFGIAEEQNFGGVSLNATWDADLFGRLRNASAAARASLLASQASRDAVRLAVAAAAAQGFVNLCALDARLEVLQRTLQARADSLRLIKRRADAGYSPQLDLRQAEAEYHAAEQLIPVTQLAIRRQEDGLSLLLGRNPGDISRSRSLRAVVPPTVPAGLPASLLRRRPDIAAAEQQLVAADRSLDSLRAAFLPDVSLSAQGGAVVADLIARNPTGVYTIEASILSPILDAGRLRAQQGVAAARRNQAAYAYRKSALSAFRDVEDALASTQRLAEQETALVAQRDALAAALRQATARYRAGYSPYLEQLDADRAVLASELTLVQTRADRLNAAVALFQALGGGWDRDPVRRPVGP